MAEEVGFEPTRSCPLTVFKTVAFDHSATPPAQNQFSRRHSAVDRDSHLRTNLTLVQASLSTQSQ